MQGKLSVEGGSNNNVGTIFQTMAYDGQRAENFSNLLGWLAPRHNMITSIVNGEWTDSFRNKETFLIGNTTVELGTGTDELLEGILKSETCSGETEPGAAPPTLAPQERQQRLEKFKNLMERIKTDLCVAESIATEVPAWQIADYDEPSWSSEMSPTNEIPLDVMPGSYPRSENKFVLIHLSRQAYSLRKILSTILIPVIQFDGKFILAMNISSPQDSSCILPIAYLTDALNKSKIRKAPIDLLLLDRSTEEDWGILKRKSNACKIYVGGNWGPQSHLPLRLLSGVFTSASEVRGAHIIVDSSADVQTAVESISANVWSSGTKVNLRARTLLFAHQPIYRAVIESLQEKMNQLRIETSTPALKMTDFIKRSQVSIDSKELLLQGAKVIFATGRSDFTDATLVYDIGTSSPLIASPTAGSGHILVVIPFRNTAELLSLTNNFDHNNDVFIYTSNVTFFKQTASLIKAANVWLNTSKSCGVSVPNDSYNVALLREPSGEDYSGNERKTEQGNEVGSSAGQDKFLKLLQGAEKSQKSWQATTVSKRTTILESLLQSISNNEPENLGADKRVQCLGDLIKVAGRVYDSNGLAASSASLAISKHQPLGLVGILLVNVHNMNIQTKLMPLIMSAVKGNVSIVMSVSTADSSNDSLAGIQAACASTLPPGIVQFLSFSNPVEAIRGASKHGKFNLLWVIHDGENSSLHADQFQMNAFNRIIIDTELGSRIPFISRSQLLELPTAVHM